MSRYHDIQHAAAVIKIKGRYFYGFGKKGQVLTAWALLGAKFYQVGSPQLAEVVSVLVERRKGFEVMRMEPV